MEDLKKIIDAISAAAKEEGRLAKAVKEANEEKKQAFDCYFTAKKNGNEAAEAMLEEYGKKEKAFCNLMEQEHFLRLYKIELTAEALSIYSAHVAKEILKNRKKLEGVPARFKKVSDFLKNIKIEGFSCFVNSRFWYIETAFNGLYCCNKYKVLYILETSEETGEKVFNFSRVAEYAGHVARTPEEIENAVRLFIDLKKEEAAAEEEHKKRISEIHAKNACRALNFTDKY